MSLEQDLNIDQNKDWKIDWSEAKNLVNFVKEEKNRKVITEWLRSNKELFLLAKRAFERSLKDIKQKYKAQQKPQLIEDEILVLKAYLYVCEWKSIEQSGLLTDTITEDVQNLINELTYWVIKQWHIESWNYAPNDFAITLNADIELAMVQVKNLPTWTKYVWSKKDYLEILQAIKQDYDSSDKNIFDWNTDLILSLENIKTFFNRLDNKKHEDLLPSDFTGLLWDCWVFARYGFSRIVELLWKYVKNLNHICIYDPSDNRWELFEWMKKVYSQSEKNTSLQMIWVIFGGWFNIWWLKINSAETWPELLSWIIDWAVDFWVSYAGTLVAPDKTLEDIYKWIKSLINIPLEDYLKIVDEIGEYIIKYPQESINKSAYMLWYILFLLLQICKWKVPKQLWALNLKESRLKNTLNELVATKTAEEWKIAGLEWRISNLRQKWAKLSLEASVPKRFSEFKEDAITQLRQICEDIKSGKSSLKLMNDEITALEKQIKDIETQLEEINRIIQASNMSPTLQEAINKKLSEMIKWIQEWFDKSDNSNVLRWWLQAIISKMAGLRTLLESKLPNYMVWIWNDPSKTEKLSVEFTDIKFFDKIKDLNIIENVTKLKDYLSDAIVSQIRNYILDKWLGEYINIEKLKENIQGWMQWLSDFESIVANNIKEAINQFVDKIRNGVARDSNGEYASLVDRLMDIMFSIMEWKQDLKKNI